MKDIGYYNGTIGNLDEMTVPMNDRAGYFGDGIYETALVPQDNFPDLDKHIDRFFRGAAAISMTVPFEKNELKQLLKEVTLRSEYDTKFLYWQLTRGTARRMHTFPEGTPNLWITVTEGFFPDLKKKLHLITTEDRRHGFCNIKTLNLLPNVLAAEQARLADCDEAIFVRDGMVTECSHSNIHILKGKTLYTAPAGEHVLPGIGRYNLIRACHKLLITVEETAFSTDMLFEADEVILSSTSRICQRAEQIDGIPVGQKADVLFRNLQSVVSAAYTASVRIPLPF